MSAPGERGDLLDEAQRRFFAYKDRALKAEAELTQLREREKRLVEALKRLANYEGITTPCEDRLCGECRAASIARAALSLERERVVAQEMLGSYEALARSMAAEQVFPLEQTMNWDGPIVARRALGWPEKWKDPGTPAPPETLLCRKPTMRRNVVDGIENVVRGTCKRRAFHKGDCSPAPPGESDE